MKRCRKGGIRRAAAIRARSCSRGSKTGERVVGWVSWQHWSLVARRPLILRCFRWSVVRSAEICCLFGCPQPNSVEYVSPTAASGPRRDQRTVTSVPGYAFSSKTHAVSPSRPPYLSLSEVGNYNTFDFEELFVSNICVNGGVLVIPRWESRAVPVLLQNHYLKIALLFVSTSTRRWTEGRDCRLCTHALWSVAAINLTHVYSEPVRMNDEMEHTTKTCTKNRAAILRFPVSKMLARAHAPRFGTS